MLPQAGPAAEGVVMAQVKTVAEWMAERGLSLAELVQASGLDDRVVEAIVQGRYTPSPEHRRRLAAALGVGPEQVAWGHVAQVEHVYGHGPQFGRSP
jgi:transcriptional regulator with XRE-family HTH domain